MDGTQFGNTLASSAVSYLVSRYGSNYTGLGNNPGQVNQVSLSFISSAYGNVFVDAIYMSDDTGLEWIAVIATEETAIIGTYVTIIAIVAALSFCAATLGLILGIISTTLVTRPLVKVVNELMLVQDMQLDEVDMNSHPIFQELRSIQKTFFTTVKRLKEYKAFLPSYILSRDFGEEEDDEEYEKSFHSKTSIRGSRQTSNLSDVISSTDSKRSKSKGLGVEIREISIVYIEIMNLDKMDHVLLPGEVTTWHGNLLNEVLNVSKKTKGDLTHFDERHFMLTWNATKSLKKHCVFACAAATMIKQYVNQLDADIGFDVKVSAVTGKATCGTIGTHSKRVFCIYGYLKEQAESLCKLNSILGTTVLINEDMYQTATITTEFEVRPIIKVIMKGKKSNAEQNTFELLARKKKHTDAEWMYEMDAKIEKYLLFTKAYTEAENGNIRGAIELLQQHAEQDPSDLVAAKLIQMYEATLQQDMKYVCVEFASSEWSVLRN
jgi:hypothetical protein